MAVCSYLLCFALIKLSHSEIFSIETSKYSAKIPDNFLSVCIDVILETHWNHFDFNSVLVNTLSSGLSPSYLRFSGTASDSTYYNINNEKPTRAPYGSNITQILNMSQLSTINQFALNNNWNLIIGINVQTRYDNNTWDPQNAMELIDYIINHLHNNRIIAFELGNEPNLFGDPQDKNNGFIQIKPTQLAQDFVIFNDILISKYGVNKKPYLFGCDATYKGITNYLFPFINALPKNKNIIDGITWHHYYGHGPNYTLNDFISVSLLDTMITYINDTINIRNEYNKNIPVILGESGPWSDDGGCPFVPAFVAGFMWLDQLGLAASFGLNNVIREAFWTGTNSIIGQKNYNPRPDYWNSWFFKNLIGNKVLYVDGQFNKGRYIRVYAFCTRTKDKGSVYQYKLGSVTVLILNLNNNTQIITLNVVDLKNNNDVRYDLFLLTGNNGNITSDNIYLNGNIIQMVNDKTFSVLNPVTNKYGNNITMKALSYGFVIVANANISVC